MHQFLLGNIWFSLCHNRSQDTSPSSLNPSASDCFGVQSTRQRFLSVCSCWFGSCYLFWFCCSRQQKCHASAPPPAGVRRRMERNRQKPVGRDKGRLTEQQTKGTATTTIQKRGIHRTKLQNRARRTELLSWTEPLLCPPEPRVSSRSPAPPHQNPAWRHMVWNILLCLARWGQPAQLCPFPGFRWKWTLSYCSYTFFICSHL